MKRVWVGFFFYFFQGAGAISLGQSLARIGKMATGEYIKIAIGLACFAISMVIWFKYQSTIEGASATPLKFPRIRFIDTRYPMLFRFLSGAVGIIVLTGVFIIVELFIK
jgi:hypothetical protein